jgi:hypothetical protein
VPTEGRRPAPDRAPSVELGKLAAVQPRDYLIRFALGAGVSVVAGLLAKFVGVRFGGAFLAFPAILPATLTLIQEKDGTRDADRNAIGAVLGGLGLVAFATVAESGFGRLPSPVVLLLALAAWMTTSGLLYLMLALLRPEAADKHLDD